MLKKYLLVFLASLLATTMFPAFALSSFAEESAEAEGNGAEAIANAFGQYQIDQNVVESSGGIDVPVKLTTYVKDKTAHNSETVFYVINHLEERIGQESDVSILTDFINEGYIVVVADYQKHPNAIASKIEYSIQALRNDISKGKYIGGLKFAATYKSEINFMVPAGYRLARDITYFNLLDQGCKGTAELIVKAWNSDSFKSGKGKSVPACEGNNYKGGWFEATDITQLVRPDKLNGNVAIPLDFDLGLDIVYPSNPTRETPVTVTASSWEQREGVNLGSKAGLFSTALVFRGFTCAVYSHEYYPMARDDHYGYWGGDYGLAKWNGVKTHTAAIRCIKYFSEQYGYSAENIGVGGGSKASYCSLLGQENPELRAELYTYTGTYDDQYGNVAQPWQTYKNSDEKITGQVQAVYTYMGDGTNLHASIVNETTAPTIIACGILDQFGCWDKWPACQATYMKWDVPHLAISMYDLGHTCPYGQDPDLDYERTQSAADFYDYWLNDAAPKLVYTNPVNNSTSFKGEDPIQIQFTGEFDLSEVSSKVKVIDVTNNRELSGTWTTCAGNTKFEFVGPDYVNGNTYSIVIPETLTDRNGKAIAEGVTRTFVSASDLRLAAVKDAYVVSGSTENKGTETVINLSGNTSKGYLEFDITSVKNKSVSTRLALDVTNDAINVIDVYALAEDAAAWQENSILWDNAPAASTLVSSVAVSGAGRYMADITDYISSIDGNSVRLVLVNRIAQGGTVYDVKFDYLSSFKKATGTIENAPFSTYDYRVGGAPAATGLSSEEDHTTGSGKSFKMTRNYSYDRFKLYNTLKTSAMTEADIGTTYRATLWAKSDTAISLTLGVMSPYGDSFGSKWCGTTSDTKLVAGEWTQCELIYTITDRNFVKAADGTISEIACLLTVQGSGTSPIYVDDVKVEVISTDVTLSSREGDNAPTLYVDTNVGAASIGKTQYASFADALAAVPTDGTATTIALREDVTLKGGLSIPAGMNLTLDLGGHTLSLTSSSNVSGSYAPFVIKGRLILKNGTFIGRNATQYQFHVWNTGLENDSYLEFAEGLTVDTNAAYGAVTVGKGDSTNAGTFVMKDGANVKCTGPFIYTYIGSPVTLYGGNVENTAGANLFVFRGTNEKVIYGGTYKSVPTDSQQLFRQVDGMVLKGGTFSEYTKDKGGKWAKIADGYMMKENADGSYSIINSEAKIGTTAYETFAEALAAVPTNGTKTTITLVRNAKLTAPFAVPAGADLTLDLGGFSLDATGLKRYSGSSGIIHVAGSLSIGNGTLTASGSENATVYTFQVSGPNASTVARLTFTDGFVLNTSNKNAGAIRIGTGTSAPGFFTSGDGVTVVADRYLFLCYGGSGFDISGGSYTDTKEPMLFYCEGTGSRTISGGTFVGKTGATANRSLFYIVPGMVLSGGTFNEYPKNTAGEAVTLAADHEVIDNGNGTYTVRKIPKGLMIGNTEYTTLESAMEAVPTDGTATTITLLSDVTTTKGMYVKPGMNLTVDLNGLTLTLSGTARPSGHFASLGVKGVLKIGNGNLVIDGAKQYGIHVYNTGTNSGAKMELLERLNLQMINPVDTHGLFQLGNQTGNSGELIVHDGVNVTSEYRIFYAYTDSSFTIYGGNFENTRVTEMFYTLGTTPRTIYGGNFKSTPGASKYKLFRQPDGITLWGGTYSEIPSPNSGTLLFGDNREVVENADGTYTVKKLRFVGEPTDFTYVSQSEPDKNFGDSKTVLLTGENGKNMIVLAEFNAAELANLKTLRIPVCGESNQIVSIAVIDGWSFDASTVTYNNVQDKLWAELMTTEKAGRHVGRYTIGTTELTINTSDILAKVTGDVFTLVLQADEKYVFDLNFNNRTEMSISEGASQGVIGNTNTLNVPYDPTYMAARGGHTPGCEVAFASHADKDGKDSMMFRVTQGGQRYRFYNLFSTDTLTVLDIGRTFRISFDVMTTIKQSNSLNVGLHCRKSGDGITSPTSGGEDNDYKNYAGNWRYKDQKVTTNANEWKTYTFEVTIDEFMINHQIGMLCMNFGNLGANEYFYIDNIKAEEINGNETATTTTFSTSNPVAFVPEVDQIALGDKVTIIEANASMSALDTDATYANVIMHGNDTLLRVDNKTGTLQITVNGKLYSLCDEKGNVYTVGANSIPVAAIIDKTAGTVRYAVDGKLAYYLDGTTVTNTYGAVALSAGFTKPLTVGAMSNPHGALAVSDVTSRAITSDEPTIVGTQMSTVNSSVRVLSGIDSLYYSGIGFRAIRGDGTTKEWKTSVVFTSVEALGKTETAESLGVSYLSGFIVSELDKAKNGETFTVIPLAYVGDTMIEGDAVTFTISVDGNTISVTANN